jgi:hypothetical protein
VTAPRTLGAVLVLAALAAGLAACGKRGPLKPPAGQESGYTYPRAYPAPKGVLPARAGPAEEEDTEETGRGTRKLSPIPPSSSRTTTTTYGTLPE